MVSVNLLGKGLPRQMTPSWSERMISHTGTETRSRLPTGGSSGEYCTMGETLMQQRRVEEETLRGVNSFPPRKKMTVLDE